MIGPVDAGLFALICLGALAVMFMVGVYGLLRAAAEADRQSRDEERDWLHELKRLRRP